MKREPDLTDAFLRELLGAEDDLEAAGLVALAAPAAAPSPSLRDRIGDSLRATHRFDDLEAAFAELVDLPADRARDLLLAIDGPIADRVGAWQEGPAPGVHLLHFRGGARVADAVTGLVRLPEGVEFPHHRHLGDEAVMVLQGAFRDSGGTTHGRGQIVHMPAGSQHSLVSVGPVPLCYAAVIHHGVEIGGVRMAPDDPRA